VLQRRARQRGVDIGHVDELEVLLALITEARAGGMSLPELDEIVERAA
jgi:hypothetical protein